MPLADWNDVLDARRAADQTATAVDEPHAEGLKIEVGEAAGAAILEGLALLDALRHEIRALGVTISYAVDEIIRGR